ncbi:MAG: hypothetical protein ABSG19_13565 [Candidatus Aminicenantales bacterium]
MNYQELREALKEIIATVESVPGKYQEKCFEILLNGLMGGISPRQDGVYPPPPAPPAEPAGQGIPIKSQVRVFLKKTDITEDDLKKVLLFEDDDVHFIKEPKTTNSALGQIQWALLLALKNGILKNNFSVDAESVRSVCQDKGFYHAANFARNFKMEKHAKLFKNPLLPQGEPSQLTDDGYTELAKFIRDSLAD